MMRVSFPQGLKPQFFNDSFTAGLKACSTPREQKFQGLKPKGFDAANGTAPQPSLAGLGQAKRSSHALTLVSSWTLLPQRLKPVLIHAGAAGLKACSTPWKLSLRIGTGIHASSTRRGTQQSCKLMAFAPGGVR